MQLRVEAGENGRAGLFLAVALAALIVLGLSVLLFWPHPQVDRGGVPLPTRLPANVDEPVAR